jgi:acyl-CoA thioesterase YciA
MYCKPVSGEDLINDDMPKPTGGAHLRTVALPRDANASGDIFGG